MYLVSMHEEPIVYQWSCKGVRNPPITTVPSIKLGGQCRRVTFAPHSRPYLCYCGFGHDARDLCTSLPVVLCSYHDPKEISNPQLPRGRKDPQFSTATQRFNSQPHHEDRRPHRGLRPENLSLTTIIVGSTLILILAAVVPVIRQWYRLRHIPGPFLNSITSLVLVYHSWKEDHCTYVYRLCQEYGPLVRVAPNVVVFSDGPTFRYICSVKANYTKGLWFEFTRWDLERYSCIAMRDNESRKERKMKLLPAVRSHLILNTYT